MQNQLTKQKRNFEINLPANRSVDFLICGTQKGGTSALDAYLREHPEICMADRKEVHFFDNHTYYRNNKPDYSNYHSWFNPKESHKLIGEATPIYMYWYSAPRRIWDYNPDIKLIVLLRNPIERAYSHWNMERSRGTENISFWDAIKNERQRCREALPQQHRVYSYIDRGHYLEQLRRLWTYFPKNQILVMKNESLKEHPNEALKNVCEHLGVSQLESIEVKHVFSHSYKLKMSKKERDYLKFVFEYEIRELERVLTWDCSEWLD